KDQNVQQSKTIDSDTQQDIDGMSNLSGGEFDREFVNMMVSDHEKAIELFRDQQSSAQNRDVKNYVDQALPKLEMHLDKSLRRQRKLFSGPNKPVSLPHASLNFSAGGTSFCHLRWKPSHVLGFRLVV